MIVLVFLVERQFPASYDDGLVINADVSSVLNVDANVLPRISHLTSVKQIIVWWGWGCGRFADHIDHFGIHVFLYKSCR